MTIHEFLDRYPAIKERAYKDTVIRQVLDKHINDYSEYNVNENELLYKLFLSANLVREELDKKLKEYINGMPYQPIIRKDKVNGSQ